MSPAPRRSVPAPLPEPSGPRAKALRPFERGQRRPLRSETIAALESFERAALRFEAARDDASRAVLRTIATRAMDELWSEHLAGALPLDLDVEVERWEEGQFRGTRADVELANFAISELLESPVRVDEGPSEDEELE